MNLNKVFIVGRVTKELTLKTTPGGQSVTSFGMATNRTWTGKDGQKQEQAEFHNVVAWGRTAEVICQYAVKGSELLIEGRLQTRSWDDKTSGQKRYITEIVAEGMQLGAKPQGAAQPARAADTRPPLGGKRAPAAQDDEIPVISLDDEPVDSGEIDPQDIPF